MTHYHIRWQGSKLDWEAFQTQEAAQTQAAAMALPNETFAVEEFDGNCPKCSQFVQRFSLQPETG